MRKILTLDPGATTGYCLAVYEDPSLVHLTYGERKLTVGQLNKALYDIYPDDLVCEDFEYRQRARAGLDLTPVKMIGVVELYLETAIFGTEGFFQSAAQGKGHFTDDKIRELGIYKKGVRHGRDACRHFLQWLMFGPGYQLVENQEPRLNLVEEEWILGAYWGHARPFG